MGNLQDFNLEAGKSKFVFRWADWHLMYLCATHIKPHNENGVLCTSYLLDTLETVALDFERSARIFGEQINVARERISYHKNFIAKHDDDAKEVKEGQLSDADHRANSDEIIEASEVLKDKSTARLDEVKNTMIDVTMSSDALQYIITFIFTAIYTNGTGSAVMDFSGAKHMTELASIVRTMYEQYPDMANTVRNELLTPPSEKTV